MKNKLYSKKTQLGLSLIEVMISLLISALLIAGTIQIFIGSKQAYRTNEALARVQESGRFAIDFMTRDLRMAGFYGCLEDVKVTNRVNSNPNDPEGDGFNFQDGGVTGMDAFYGNSDRLIIRRADGGDVEVRQRMPLTSAALLVNQGLGLEVWDIVVVTDCEKADIFQIVGCQNPSICDSLVHNSGVGTPGNASKDFSKIYEPPAFVMRAIEVVYYLDQGSGNRSALFRIVNGQAPVELVDNVDDFQVTYGLDRDGDRNAEIYVDATTIENEVNLDWDMVVAVGLELTTSSGQDFVALTNDAVFGDRRLRHTFSTNVTLRNRTP